MKHLFSFISQPTAGGKEWKLVNLPSPGLRADVKSMCAVVEVSHFYVGGCGLQDFFLFS